MIVPLAFDAQRRGIRPSLEPIRLVLLDDQHLMRHALRSLLAHDPRYVFIGDTARRDECLSLVANGGAQVVLLNGDMRFGEALRTVLALNQLPKPPFTVALSDTEDPDRIRELCDAGVVGFLLKSATLIELREAIDAVASGGRYLRASGVLTLASGALASGALASGSRASGSRASPRGDPSCPEERMVAALSRREMAVLVGIAQGHSGRAVAEQLGITVKTVDTYRRRITVKTGLHRRADFVKTALALGLLTG